jgi:anti-sigma regulatory factor (Ser/Thr protein kinase)
MSQSKLPPITVSGNFDKMGESLKLLREYAVQAAEQAGLPKLRVEGVRLAVDEYATNIITYGYRDARLVGDISASVTLDDDYMILSLVDSAAPFDPTKATDPMDELDKQLEDRPIGGLGIMLARQNTDEWRYERIGNRNYNHFVIKRQ